ncbi:MAG TPA: IS1595 family transposase [Bacteroidales bacterium]|nr:IS1595 family transposase [Bacteroidales bacterium]
MEIGKGKQGRGAETKTLVVVATECNGKQIGRVRFKCIPDASGENLIGFIEENIEFGSKIITDGWSGYSSLSKLEKYEHEVKIISGSGQEAHERLPHVHLVDSLVKRWINALIKGKFHQNICHTTWMNMHSGLTEDFLPIGGSYFIGWFSRLLKHHQFLLMK